MLKRINGYKVKMAYYQCSDCGRQISSDEYYTYGKCDRCRWC